MRHPLKLCSWGGDPAEREVAGKDLFFTVGPELEYRFAPCSKGRVSGCKTRTLTSDLDLHPNVNLMAQFGYDNVGFIAKASLIELFNDPEPGNPRIYPVTLGFSIFY